MTEPIVALHGVSAVIGDFRALHHVSLTLLPGQRAVLIGPSGSGKSTILRCINGLQPVQTGSLRLFGKQPRSGGDWQAARLRMETIFQNYALYGHLNVLDNITLAPRRLLGQSRDEAEAVALQHLEVFGVSHLAKSRPEALSGGQRQRVAIARALAKRPELLLLDEPTAALDPENIGNALAVIDAVAQSGVAMLSVTHELGFAARHADIIHFVDRGQIIESGPPDNLLTNPQTTRAQSFLHA